MNHAVAAVHRSNVRVIVAVTGIALLISFLVSVRFASGQSLPKPAPEPLRKPSEASKNDRQPPTVRVDLHSLMEGKGQTAVPIAQAPKKDRRPPASARNNVRVLQKGKAPTSTASNSKKDHSPASVAPGLRSRPPVKAPGALSAPRSPKKVRQSLPVRNDERSKMTTKGSSSLPQVSQGAKKTKTIEIPLSDIKSRTARKATAPDSIAQTKKDREPLIVKANDEHPKITTRAPTPLPQVSQNTKKTKTIEFPLSEVKSRNGRKDTAPELIAQPKKYREPLIVHANIRLQPPSNDKLVAQILKPSRESGGAYLLSEASMGRGRMRGLGPMASLPYQRRIEVPVGMFHIIRSSGTIQTVAVGDPQIADVQVLSTQAVLVNGRKPGTTSLVIWDRNGIQQHEIVVTGYPTSLIEDIRQAIANPEVSVRIVRDSIVLEGEVKDDDEKNRVGQIAALFADKVTNLVRVRAEAPTIKANVAAQIRTALAMPSISVEAVGDQIILRGEVETQDQRTQAEATARRFTENVINMIKLKPYSKEELEAAIGLPNVEVSIVRDQIILTGKVASAEEAAQAVQIASRQGQEVVNRLMVPPPPIPPAQKTILDQIQDAINEGMETGKIKVRGTPQRIILEGETEDLASADRAYKIAQGFLSEGGTVDTSLLFVTHANLINLHMYIMEINRDRAKRLGFEYPPFDNANTPFIFGEQGGIPNNPIRRLTPITVNVFGLATSNAVRILSQPNTTVLSGRIARFQVGGEVPIPSFATTGTGIQQQSVEFRPFGLIFLLQPSINPDGEISLDIRTQVSAVDDTRAAIINGTRVPGFSTREANTYVHVPDGGTLGIGGLIDRRDLKVTRSVPLISAIPVIGRLFQSREFQRNESELVVFVRVQSTGQPIRQAYTPAAVAPPAGMLPPAINSLSGSGGR